MAATQHGTLLSKLLNTNPGGTIEFSRDGSVTATETYECAWKDGLDLAPKRYITQHPDYPTLIADDIIITREPGDVAQIRVKYVGLPSNNDVSPPNEETNCSASQVPIDVHPKFVSDIGGKKGSPKHNAQFDDKNKFTNFPVTESDNTTLNIYAGVQVYYEARTTFTRNFISTEKINDYSDVGKIASPKPTGAPQIGAKGNYLLMNRVQNRQGGIYRITETFAGSGDNGWDPVIYSKT
jgi:hypothetical protein